jgi:hypothetical protein
MFSMFFRNDNFCKVLSVVFSFSLFHQSRHVLNVVILSSIPLLARVGSLDCF